MARRDRPRARGPARPAHARLGGRRAGARLEPGAAHVHGRRAVRRHPLPQRQRDAEEDRPADGRPRLGRDDGAHRARRRLRRRCRSHQGDRAAGRLVAHRGRQAVHHLGRAGHDREHRASGAGASRGCRPGHEGALAVRRPEVPLRRRDRRARRAQRRLRHQRRAQDGPEGLDHLRAALRREPGRSGQGLARRRRAQRHRADVPGDRARPDDGRHQGDRDPVDRVSQRARLRQDARAVGRPHPGRRQGRAARDDHQPPGRAPQPDDEQGLRRRSARARLLHRDRRRTASRSPSTRAPTPRSTSRSTTCCCRS